MMINPLQTNPWHRNSLLPVAIVSAATGCMQAHATEVKSFGIEEIVVTAQKRAQSAQDVSIAINAFDAKTLKQLGVQTANDLGAYTPNLNVKNSTGNGNPIFTVRGLGVSTFASNSNPSVGMYIDEVYLMSNNMMGFSTFDIERVEVLKGPQGTLFGRNTTGGAVSFVTKKPNPEETEGELNITLGNYETTNVDGAINLPLSDTLAARFAFTSQKQDKGFIHNRLTGEDISGIDRQYARMSLLWEPTDSLTVNANLHAGRDTSTSGPWQAMGKRDPNDPTLVCDDYTQQNAAGAFANCVDVSGYRDPDGDDPFEGEFSGAVPNEVKSSGGVLNISWDINDQLNLTSVTGVENLTRNVTEDFDGGPNRVADNTYDNEMSSFQQELRLAASNDRVDWMVGAFYSTDDNDTTDHFGYADRFLTDLLVAFDQSTDTMALFANTQWHLSDKIDVIAGVRWTKEETTWDGSTRAVNVVSPTGFANILGDTTNAEGDIVEIYGHGEAVRDETINATEATYKLGIDYHFNEDVLLYANVSRGFKSGGFDGVWALDADGTLPFDSEEVIAIEAGAKSTLLDGLMQLNAAVFSYDYTDMQVFGTDLQGRFRVSNAGDADVRGLELDVWYRPIEGLDIKTTFGYNDNEFVEYRSATADYKGNILPNASKTSFSALVRYEFPVANGFRLAPMVDATYKSKAYYTAENTKLESQDGYTLVNARLSLLPDDDKWEVALWAKNLEDRVYYTEAFDSGSAGLIGRLVGAPRTYGLSFNYQFN